MRDFSAWPDGKVTPRIETAPLRELTPATSLGFLCIQFATTVLGITLAPWQQHAVIRLFELRPEGGLRFRTAVILVARQNGKTELLKVIGLFYMLVIGAGSDVVSLAQDLETAEEALDETLELVQGTPGLAAKLKGRPSMKSGQRRFRFKNASRWLAKASNRKSGRGKSTALVLFDELREQLDFEAWDAVSSTTLTKDMGLVVGFSNAGDAKSAVLRTLRQKATDAVDDPDTRMLILEWSAPEKSDLDDPEALAQANPGVGQVRDMSRGIVHTWEDLMAQRGSSTDVAWQTENMCQWVTAMKPGPWAEGVWEGLLDPGSRIAADSPVCLAVDVPMDYSLTSIMIAGYREDGSTHVERIARKPGDAWVGPWLDKRWEAIGAKYVVIQGRGAPATQLIEDLVERGIPIAKCQGSDVTGSYAEFYQAVRDKKIRHLGQAGLNAAALSAETKATGDGLQMWDRAKSRPLDVAPLIGASEAAYGLWNDMEVEGTGPVSFYEDHGLVVV